MYDGKIQQLGKVVDIDSSPQNYLIAKIMGTPNIWQVHYIENEAKNTILATNLGKLKIPKNITRKVTGINISPSNFKITFDTEEKLEKTNLISFKGYIKSVIQRDEQTDRMVIEITADTIEYVKVDVEKTLITTALSPNQEILLYVDPLEIQIL